MILIFLSVNVVLVLTADLKLKFILVYKTRTSRPTRYYYQLLRTRIIGVLWYKSLLMTITDIQLSESCFKNTEITKAA